MMINNKIDPVARICWHIRIATFVKCEKVLCHTSTFNIQHTRAWFMVQYVRPVARAHICLCGKTVCAIVHIKYVAMCLMRCACMPYSFPFVPQQAWKD